MGRRRRFFDFFPQSRRPRLTLILGPCRPCERLRRGSGRVDRSRGVRREARALDWFAGRSERARRNRLWCVAWRNGLLAEGVGAGEAQGTGRRSEASGYAEPVYRARMLSRHTGLICSRAIQRSHGSFLRGHPPPRDPEAVESADRLSFFRFWLAAENPVKPFFWGNAGVSGGMWGNAGKYGEPKKQPKNLGYNTPRRKEHGAQISPTTPRNQVMVAAIPQSAFCKEFADALVQLEVPRRFANLAAKKLASVRVVRESTRERTLTGPLADLCVTINQAARDLGVSRTTAYSWLNAGRLKRALYPGTRQPIQKINGMTVVSRESVEMLLKSPQPQ